MLQAVSIKRFCSSTLAKPRSGPPHSRRATERLQRNRVLRAQQTGATMVTSFQAKLTFRRLVSSIRLGAQKTARTASTSLGDMARGMLRCDATATLFKILTIGSCQQSRARVSAGSTRFPFAATSAIPGESYPGG
jgi:hypothetical protein